jgi:hypothetical protein
MKAILILTLMWSTFSFSKPKKDCEAGEVKLPKHNMFQSMEKMTEVVANDDFEVSLDKVEEICLLFMAQSSNEEIRAKTRRKFFELFGIKGKDSFYSLNEEEKNKIQRLWNENHKKFMCEGDDYNYETGDPLQVYFVSYGLSLQNRNFISHLTDTLKLNINHFSYDNLAEGYQTPLDVLDQEFKDVLSNPELKKEYEILRESFLAAGAKKCSEIPECKNL